MSAPDRRAMLDRADRTLSLRRQCALLGVARSGVYRPRTPPNDNDAALMRWIDELFTAWPFLGSRRMTAMLRGEGVFVNRKRVQRLMRLMGIAALRAAAENEQARARPQDLSLRSPAAIWTIERANHGLGCRHHLYSAIGRGFLYLVAIIDAGHRARCLGGGCRTRWTLSFYLAALEEALAKFGKPEIFNTDQGSRVHFGRLHRRARRRGHRDPRMGRLRGRWMDNVFI